MVEDNIRQKKGENVGETKKEGEKSCGYVYDTRGRLPRSSKRGNSLKHRGYRDERERHRGQLFSRNSLSLSLSVLRLASVRRSPHPANGSFKRGNRQQARSTRYRDSADSPTPPPPRVLSHDPPTFPGDFSPFPPERGHTVEKGTMNKAGERIRPRLCVTRLLVRGEDRPTYSSSKSALISL